MASLNCENCTTNITLVITTKTDASQNYLLGQEKKLSSPHQKEVHSLYGKNGKIQVNKAEYIAQSLETNQNTSHLTLSERLTPSLISAGLVRGTTLTFGLRLLSRGIPAGVLYAPDGSVADIPSQGNLF